MKRPSGITAIAVILMIMGGIPILLGLIPNVLVYSCFAYSPISLFARMSTLQTLLCVGTVATGVGLLKLRPWARITAIVATLVVSAGIAIYMLGLVVLGAAFGGPDNPRDSLLALAALVVGVVPTVLVWRYFRKPAIKALFMGNEPKDTSEV